MAHPLQSVGNALSLGPQLLGVGHVAELAAAAFAVKGTVGFNPLGGGEKQFHPAAPGHIFVHLLQADTPPFPRDGIGDKDHPPLQPGYAHPFGRKAGDVQGVDSVLFPFDHGMCPFSVRFGINQGSSGVS